MLLSPHWVHPDAEPVMGWREEHPRGLAFRKKWLV